MKAECEYTVVKTEWINGHYVVSLTWHLIADPSKTAEGAFVFNDEAAFDAWEDKHMRTNNQQRSQLCSQKTR